MFIDEEQWSRAFKAAMQQVEILYSTGKIEIPHGKVNGPLRDVAVQIATAALRAAAQDDEGDVGDLPGVMVARIPNRIPKGSSPVSDEGGDDDLGRDTLRATLMDY